VGVLKALSRVEILFLGIFIYNFLRIVVSSQVVSKQCEARLEEGSLILTKTESSSKYELEEKTSTGFTLFLCISTPPTPLLLLSSLSSIDLLLHYNISQHNLHVII